MTVLSVQPPFPILTDINGQPLEDGYIWIGVVNLAPITNPITVYWDAALTIPVAQPIRTRGGFPVNSGTPANLYVDRDYSIQVQDKNGSVIYTSLSANQRYGDLITMTVLNIAALRAKTWVPDRPTLITLINNYVVGDGGGSFRWDSTSTATDNGGTIIKETAVVTGRWIRQNTDIINVTWFGARGDGVTNDTAAIQEAINANPGKIIFFPKGNYAFTQLTITSNGTTLMGEAMLSSTTFIPLNTTGNDVVFSGCQHSQIQDINFRPTVKKTAGYAVYFTAAAYKCKAVNVRVDYGFNGFGIFNGTENEIIDCQCRYMLGVKGVYFGGSTGSYRAVINNLNCDNPYPNGYGTGATAVKTYTPATSYAVSDIVSVSNHIWQCSQSGTTGAASAPSGYPGATAPDVFTTPVTDGTVQWKFVSHVSLTWINQDSFGYSLVIDKAAVLNGARGFAQTDTVNSGSSYPIWTFAWDLEIDHSFFGGVFLEQGEGCYINGSWIGSVLNGNGVLVEAGYRGEVHIGSGTRIMGNAEHGVLIQAGPQTVYIDGCQIGYNSQKTVSFYNGVTVAAGAIDFSILNCRIGDLRGTGSSNEALAILVETGASNKFVIANNNLFGGVGGLVDNSTGTAKVIANNVGANLNLLTPIVVGASPFSWTNNTGNAASLIVTTGTVSSILLDSYAVAAATNTQIVVPQNSTVQVAYTGLPTMLYQRL